MALQRILLSTLVALSILLFQSQASAQTIYSPCPRLFTYDPQNETDRWYGTLTLLSDVDLLDIWLRLTFDRTSQQLGNWFGQVETSDSKEYHIRKHNFELKANQPQSFRFFLKYNPREPAPRLLSFRLNGKLVCPEDMSSSSQSNTRFNRVNIRPTQLEISSQVRPSATSYDADVNVHDRVNNQLDESSYDSTETRFSTQSDHSSSTNFRDTSTRFDASSQSNTDRFSTGSRDRVNSQSNANRDRVSTQTDVNVRNRVNSQLDMTSQFGNSQGSESTTTRDRVNLQSSTQSQSNSRNTAATQSSNSRDRVNAQEVNVRDRVNTAQSSQSINARDRVSVQSGIRTSTESQIRLDTNTSDQVNTYAVSNSRDKTGTGFRDTQNAQSSTSSRDRGNTQSNTSSRDTITFPSGTNSRDTVSILSTSNFGDSINVQPNTNSQDRFNVQLSTNLRDRVNVQPNSSSRDSINTQHSANSQDRFNIQSSTTSRDVINSQTNTNSRDRVNMQPNLGFGDIINFQSSTSTGDRFNVQSSSNSREIINSQSSTNAGNRFNVQSSTNPRDMINLQPSTNYRDRVNDIPTTTSRETLNSQQSTSSQSQLSTSRNTINSLNINSREGYETTHRNMAARDNVCGTVIPRPRPLIAYGELTQEGQFPWHAALYLAKDTRLTYICGASLISRNFVITAAHCVVKAKPQKSLEPKELIIQLGKYNLKRFSIGFQDRQVSEIISHPQFSAESYRNDIALLRFDMPANITDYVRPVCLWQESTDINVVLNQIGIVIGWGYDETGKISEELMQAKMPVIPKGKCISSYPDFYTRFTSSNSYCAGFANGTSPCNGDAGGGMVFPISNSNPYNPVWQIRGLISILPAFQNQFMCDVTHYAIFTDVAKYLDWIAASMQ